jgi:hypothetical protein
MPNSDAFTLNGLYITLLNGGIAKVYGNALLRSP